MEIRGFVLLCIMLLTLQSCTEIKVTEKEMVGVWTTSDRAKLVLKKDSTFTLTGFNSLFWRFEATGKPVYKINGKGKWKIETKQERPFIKLSFFEVMNRPVVVYRNDLKEFQQTERVFLLNIMGTNSPFYNKPPWIIGVYQCVDCSEFYEFRREE